MRSWLVLAVAILGLFGLHGGSAGPKGSPWHSDLATARRLARQSGKPIFAVFR
jgi:hypothetical protein